MPARSGKTRCSRSINVRERDALQLLASPEGGDMSLQLRQQAQVYHIAMEKGEQINVQLHGPTRLPAVDSRLRPCRRTGTAKAGSHLR